MKKPPGEPAAFQIQTLKSLDARPSSSHGARDQ